MKSAEPSTGISKKSRGVASTTAPASGAMPIAKETFVDPITAVDPSSGADDVDLTIAPPLSLRAMMESFMTTKATHGQFLDKLLIEDATKNPTYSGSHKKCCNRSHVQQQAKNTPQ